jgi:hypothetical protein
LAAACKEGFGEDVFEEWMTTIKTPEEISFPLEALPYLLVEKPNIINSICED